MKYSIEKEEKYCLLTLNEGKLDTSIAPSLKSEFLTINAEGISNFILDLSEVKYTDSSGLSAILVGNRIYGENGGIFVLTGLNDHVLKLIKISQLDKVLNILPTVVESVDTVFMHELEKNLSEESDEDLNA